MKQEKVIPYVGEEDREVPYLKEGYDFSDSFGADALHTTENGKSEHDPGHGYTGGSGPPTFMFDGVEFMAVFVYY